MCQPFRLEMTARGPSFFMETEDEADFSFRGSVRLVRCVRTGAGTGTNAWWRDAVRPDRHRCRARHQRQRNGRRPDAHALADRQPPVTLGPSWYRGPRRWVARHLRARVRLCSRYRRVRARWSPLRSSGVRWPVGRMGNRLPRPPVLDAVLVAP